MALVEPPHQLAATQRADVLPARERRGVGCGQHGVGADEARVLRLGERARRGAQHVCGLEPARHVQACIAQVCVEVRELVVVGRPARREQRRHDRGGDPDAVAHARAAPHLVCKARQGDRVARQQERQVAFGGEVVGGRREHRQERQRQREPDRREHRRPPVVHGQGGQPEQRGDTQGDRKDRIGRPGCGVAKALPEARRRQVDDRRSGPDLVLALQRGVQVPQQQEREAAQEHRRGGGRRQPALAGDPVAQPDGRVPRHQHQLRQEGEQPERVRGHQHQGREGIRHHPAGPARPHQDQHEPGAEVGARDHGRVAAGELAEVDRDRRGGGHHRHHGAPGTAEQLAPEAVADGDGDDAEDRRGQAQPEDVVPPQE